LEVVDPSGLRIQLVGDAEDARTGNLWTTDLISEAMAVRGLHHARLLVNEAAPLEAFLTYFGYRLTKREASVSLWEAGEGGAGNSLVVEEDALARGGINGIGTVHHIAHRVASLDDSIAIRTKMARELGLQATQVMDRNYFESIYFRVPGGIL
ncbi:VOC family protein, partial [Arthrospira platensis SPKY1]|nr:VOC family protein [Arthrospira platensis SPKY1]